jgi:hypothetical protein
MIEENMTQRKYKMPILTDPEVCTAGAQDPRQQ